MTLLMSISLFLILKLKEHISQWKFKSQDPTLCRWIKPLKGASPEKNKIIIGTQMQQYNSQGSTKRWYCKNFLHITPKEELYSSGITWWLENMCATLKLTSTKTFKKIFRLIWLSIHNSVLKLK